MCVQPYPGRFGPKHWQTSIAEKERRALLMAEQLAAAGLRPTVYHNVVLRYGGQPVAEHDPLKELPTEEWDLEGSNRWACVALNKGRFVVNGAFLWADGAWHLACTCWVQGPSPACLFCSRRYVWMALQGEPWSPDTHAKHPPAMRAAFRAALLCVARCTKVGCRTPGCWAFHANQSGWCCLYCIASRAGLCSCSAAVSVFLAGRTRAFAPPLGSVSVLPCSRCGAGGGRQGGAHHTAACCN